MASEEQLFIIRYDEIEAGLPAYNYYEVKKIAVYLKELLLGEQPLIYAANKNKKIDIHFTVNNVLVIKDIPIFDILFHGDGLDPNIRSTKGGTRQLELEQFLCIPVFETREWKITIEELIEFGANKAYGLNFDLSKTEKETIIEKAYQRLFVWGTDSISVSIHMIARITLIALLPLRKSIKKNLSEIEILTRGSHEIKTIEFDGHGQFLSGNLTYELKQAWGWHGVLRIMPQVGFGEHVFYEIGNNDGSLPRITILTDDSGDLIGRFQNNEDEIYEVRVSKFIQTVFYGNFIYLAFEMKFGLNSEIRLFINNKLIAFKKINKDIMQRTVNYQTIGADLNGDRWSKFQIYGFGLMSCILDNEGRKSIAEYFEQKMQG